MNVSDDSTVDPYVPWFRNSSKPSRLARLTGTMLIVGSAGLVAACGGGSYEPPSTSTGPALTVARDGTGSGSVSSSPAGIACGTACLQSFSSGTAVSLTATPDLGSVFVGWTGGGCSGTGTCQVAVTAATTVTAKFDRLPVGPFTVKQTESLGGETLSGAVCDLTKQFAVQAVAPAVSWTFLFSPGSATQGTVTYAYSIPSAGETHNASGNYTVGLPAPDGTLVLSMTVRDHVTFNGFDGVIPLNYKFSLVPAATCQ
jgi:hypothetical protein